MGRARRERRRRERRDKDQQREIAAETRVAERRRRIVLATIPAVTAAAAITAFVLEYAQLAGVALLIGGLAFLLYGLASVGGKVTRRDRDRSGAIDFGTRR